MRRTLVGVALLLGVAAGPSCNRSSEPASRSGEPTAKPVVADGGPADTVTPTTAPARAAARPDPGFPRHGLRDEQLSALMRRMAAQTQRHWPEHVPGPLDDQRIGEAEQATAAAARLAEALGASAARIPDSVEHIPMSEADRAGFLAGAETLRRQASRLGEAARAGRPDVVQRSLDAISGTCLSCHSRYRDFAGELDLRWASAPDRDAVFSLNRNVTATAAVR